MRVINKFTETKEPGAREEASMEDSESQILQPLESVSMPVIWPIKADLPIKVGYRVEASSRLLRKSSSESQAADVNDGVLGDADRSEFDSLDGALDCFFDFERISSSTIQNLQN